MTEWPKSMVAIFVLLLLTACDQDNPSKEKNTRDDSQSKRFAKQISDVIPKLTNPKRSDDEIVQMLRDNLKSVDGLILVETTLAPELFVLSSNSPWVVSCGSGLAVTFGSDITSGKTDISNSVKLDLALTPLSDDRCRTLAVSVGKEVQSILAGK